MSKLLALFIIFFLMACSEPKGMPYALEFRDKGVGMLNATTPFEASKITALLLGFSVEQYTFFEAGVPKPVLLVRRGNKTILEIYPTADKEYIERIESRSLHVKNKKGIKLGTRLENSNLCQSDISDKEKLLCPLSENVFMLYAKDAKNEWIASVVLWMRDD